MATKHSVNSFKITELGLIQLEDIFAIEIAANKFPWTKAIIRQGLLADYHFLGVILDDKLIAYSVLELASVEAQLLNLCVLPNYQTLGVGRFLLQQVIKLANKNKAEKILLEVRASNQKAIKLYQNIGFKQIDLRKKYYRTDNISKEDAHIFELCFRKF